MPTATYIALANTTLTSAASSVTFSSIPATYRDLVLVVTYNSVNEFILAEFNADSGNNYPFVEMWANGTGPANSGTGTVSGAYIGYSAQNVQQQGIIHIMDYSATDKHKTCLARSGAGFSLAAVASRWTNTNAITSVKVKAQLGNFAIGNTFALYGIVS